MMIAFVEGRMERQFVNMNFKYIRLIPIQNGITWTVEQLCNQILTLFSALDVCGEVFIWLDRERRTEGVADIRKSIIDALSAQGVAEELMHVLVNDRMVENVILADEHVIRQEFGDNSYVYQFEGRGGKHILKELYKDKDINYKEMAHGINLLKKIRLEDCARNSQSVRSFISSFQSDCWWISAR